MNLMLELDLFLRRHGVRYFNAQEVTQLGRRYKGEVITMPPQRLWWHIVPTCLVLDRVRDEIGPIRIYSGYRPRAYNEAVGGATNSLHIEFNALDWYPVDKKSWPDVNDVYEVFHAAVGDIENEWCGIGVYPDPHPNDSRVQGFIHTDTRSLVLGKDPAAWSG